MSKNNNDDFLSRFANRVEKVGRDGVMGLMKSTGIPINNMRQNYFGNQDYSSSIRKNGINRANEIDKNIIDFDDRANNDNINYFNNNTYKPSIINNMAQNMLNYSNMNKNSTYKLNSAKTFLPIINNNQNNTRNNNNNLSNNDLRNSLMYSYNNQKDDNSNKNFYNSRSNIKSNSINYRYYNNNTFEPQTNNALNQRNIYSVANNRQIMDILHIP
jgi:hypothetical protein